MHVCDVFGDMKTPTNISKYTLHEHNTVLGLLERMEEKGLMKKCKGLEKKNMVSVMFTDKGLQAHELSTKRKSIHKLMSHLAKRERRQLMSILEKLLDEALEETGKSTRVLYKLS